MSTHTKMSMMTRWLAAVGVTAIVAAGAVSPAAAQPGAAFQDQGIRDMNGFPDLGRTARHGGASAHAAVTENARDAWAFDAESPRAQVRQRKGDGYFAHGAVDDPPGSAYQSFGNNQSMGLVR